MLLQLFDKNKCSLIFSSTILLLPPSSSHYLCLWVVKLDECGCVYLNKVERKENNKSIHEIADILVSKVKTSHHM